MVEGGEVAPLWILVVEDVVTSGGQLLESVRALRELGARIDHALCVLDRQAGGAEALANDGVRLSALFTWEDLEGG